MKTGAGIAALVLGLASAAHAQTTPDTMPPNSWLAVPNTKMNSVTPTNGQFPGTWGVVGPASVVIAWGGAALDTSRSRLVLWGGGHADYYGNEVYTFDVPTLKWARITDPFINPVMDQEVNADGTPNSRHTYGGLAYVAHVDRFLGQGGSLAGVGFAKCDKTWVFDFVTKTWADRNPAATSGGGFGITASYDPGTKKVWWGARPDWAGLWSYDYGANTWTKHNSDNFGAYTSTVDTKRGLLVMAGGGQVFSYDIKNGNYTRQMWATTGGTTLINKSAIGFDYDPVSDKYVGWSGGSPYILDPVTKVWTTGTSTGASPEGSNGIYGRWRYVPSVNAFIVVTGIGTDVHFYKMSAGGGTPPPSDTTPPTVTITAPPANPASPLTLSGTAADNVGVTQVTWSNGTSSGTATGTGPWTASIPLASGTNTITVTARDAAGNPGTATVTVTYTPTGGGPPPPAPPPPPPPAAPTSSEGENGDGSINDALCGALGIEAVMLFGLARLLRGGR